MFLFTFLLLAHATELEWKQFVIDHYPEVKEYFAQKEAKIRSLERENIFLFAENDELQIKNKMLEKQLRDARERIEEMEYLAERVEIEKPAKLEEFPSEKIIAEVNAYKDSKEKKEKILCGKLQPRSRNRIKYLPNDLEYYLKNLKISEDASFRSPDSQAWMRISDNDKLSVSLPKTKQRVTFNMNIPVKLKIKNSEVLNSLWLCGEIFELHSIGSFVIDIEKESQNSSQKQVSMKFVSLKTGAYILFHYWRRHDLKDYTLYARDKPVGVILGSVGQYGEKIDDHILKIGDVKVTYMKIEKFIETVNKQLENHSKK